MDYKDFEMGLSEEYFWFRSRLELIDTLLRAIPTSRKLRILSLGVGTGEELTILKKYGEVYILDKNDAVLQEIAPDLYKMKIVADVMKTPFSDNFFDLLTAFDVLEHLPDDNKAVLEFMRVLKPGGFLVLTVPAFPFLYSSHDRKLNHYRRYTIASLRTLLPGGWEKLGFWGFSLFLPFAIYRLSWKSQPSPRVTYASLPHFFNYFFYYILKWEAHCIKYGDFFPWGSSLYGIYRKGVREGRESPFKSLSQK